MSDDVYVERKNSSDKHWSVGARLRFLEHFYIERAHAVEAARVRDLARSLEAIWREWNCVSSSRDRENWVNYASAKVQHELDAFDAFRVFSSRNVAGGHERGKELRKQKAALVDEVSEEFKKIADSVEPRNQAHVVATNLGISARTARRHRPK